MKKTLIFAAVSAVVAPFSLFAHWTNTTQGEGDKTDPAKYACALISNGSISTQIDNLGVQKQKRYVSFVPQVERPATPFILSLGLWNTPQACETYALVFVGIQAGKRLLHCAPAEYP